MQSNQVSGFIILGLLILSSGCASATKPTVQAQIPGQPQVHAPLQDELVEEILRADAAIRKDDPEEEEEEEALVPAPERAELKKYLGPTIPVEVNHRVQKWIEYFTVSDRERFQSFLARGERYRPMVQGVLREQRMPEELYYLALIESGYVSHATSRASAVGIWQFIGSTGRLYGLSSRGAFLDERRDPMESTRAAARFLDDLHRDFSSWYLAMAAYNAGPGRIRKAIRRGKSRNFWVLAQKGVLPRETLNYVPKFLAAVMIGQNPGKYGFEIPESVKPYPDVERVSVPGGIALHQVAQKVGIPAQKLEEVNPQLKRMITPPTHKLYPIWVPKDVASKFEESDMRAELASLRPSGRMLASAIQEEDRESSKSIRHYRVRRGDTLEMIARRHGTSVHRLKRINGFKKSKIFAGQRIKVPRGRPGRRI